jgi:hypothetical protein
VIVLFSQLVTFCTWVAMGVVEEKSSRVVELVLSAVRPLQLLTGKLVGIGVLAAGQVLVLGVAGVVAALTAQTLTLPAAGIVTLLVAFVGFLLGFAFFGGLAAGLASTVSRQEEVSGILAPVSITLMVTYLAGFAAASSPDSGLATLPGPDAGRRPQRGICRRRARGRLRPHPGPRLAPRSRLYRPGDTERRGAAAGEGRPRERGAVAARHRAGLRAARAANV